MWDLFVSYNSANREMVERFVAGLMRRDVSVFWDQSCLLVGKHWLEELTKAINLCQSFVAFLGVESLSYWQKREIELAILRNERDSNFRIVPVFLVGRADLPVTFLSSYQGIEVKGDLREAEAIDELVAMLSEFARLAD